MSSSQVPSPSHSQGATARPTSSKQCKTRRTRSVSSGTCNTSLRLTAVIPDSFQMSPLPTRWSVLNDNTDIQIPGRPNWWKRLTDNSRVVTEVMEDRENEAKAAEEFEVEILSQEKENMSLSLPESSDGESIRSIVLPQREFFQNQDNRPQKNLKEIIHRKETLGKLRKSSFDQTNIEKDINVMPKKLFNRVAKPKTKAVFNAALFNTSPNKSVHVNNSIENPAQEVQQPVRNIFGYRPSLKGKNIYAEFVLSDSNDEFSEIQPRIFGFQRKNDHQAALRQKRLSSQSSICSTASNITDVEMGEWNHLPSSTMLDHQLEEAGGTTPIKRIRLSRLSRSKKSEDVLNKNNSLNTSDKSDSKVRPEVEKINVINACSQSLNKSKNNNQVEPKSIDSYVITNKSNSVREASQKNSSKLTHNLSMDKTLTEEDLQVQLINEEHEKTLTSENQHDQVDDENFTLEFENDDEQIFDINVTKSEANQNISNKKIEHNVDPKETDMHLQQSNEDHIASEIIESANVEIYSNQKDSKLNKTDEISKKKNLLKSPEAVLHEKTNGEESFTTHGRNTSIGKSKTIPNDLDIRPSLAPTRESSGFTDRSIGSSAEGYVWDSHRTTRQTLRQTFGKDFTPRKSLYTLIMEKAAKRQTNYNPNYNVNDQVADKSGFQSTIYQSTHETGYSKIANKSKDKSTHQSSSNKNANQAKQQTDFDANPIPSDQGIEKNEKLESDKGNKQNDEPDAEQIERDWESKQNEQFESDPNIEDNIDSASLKNHHQIEESEIDKNDHQNKESVFNKDVQQHEISKLDKNVEKNDEFETDKDIQQNEKSKFDKDFQQTEIPEEKEESVIDADIQETNESESVQNQIIESDKESEQNEEPESDENIELYNKSESEKDDTENEGIESNAESKSYNEQEQNKESELEQNEESDLEQNEEVESESDIDIEQNEEPKSDENIELYNKSESEKDHEESESSNEQNQSNEVESYREPERLEMEKTTEDADLEAARELRRENLEKYLQKMREEKAELQRKVQEKVQNTLKVQPKLFSVFKLPEIPKQQRATRIIKKTVKPKLKSTIFTNVEHLPAELFDDLKYKPPKRFQGRNAPWITKRLYKFLEDKLQPRYDYHARVRAEKLVKKLYEFSKDVRRCARAAPQEAVAELKLEMARLGVVTTHHEFYCFFHEFMPREIRIRVNPDIMNKIPLPRNVFGNIMEE